MTIKRNHVFVFHSWSKPLAYLAGVYLSDGSVHYPKGRMAIFTHSSIDKEFVDKTDSALRIILPTTTVRRRICLRTKISKNSLTKRASGKKVYEVTVSNTDFGIWLKTVTSNKTMIPLLEDKYLVHLLSAFIDGDGYINIFKDKHRIQIDNSYLRCYQAGICGVGKKMLLIVNAFKRLKVKVGKRIVGKRNVETYKINLSTLAESEICFSIHRKFYRFCEYVNQVKPSTTIRRTLIYAE